MFNALFILIVFLLQLNKGALHVDWPLGVKTNITYIEETSEVCCVRFYLYNQLSLIQYILFRSSPGFDHQRISTTGTYRFGLRVFLWPHFDHSVCGHVVPSIWNTFPYFGFNRTQLLQPQGKVVV